MTDELLTYADVERLTAIPRPTLRVWVHQQRIPHVRLGARTVRFERHEVQRWLADRRVRDG